MSDETKSEEKTDAKPDHEPPAGAETTGTWRGAATPIDYSARAKWIVLRKKEKPAAEIFSVSYVADLADAERPVTFVFNGGPGASSAYLHMLAVVLVYQQVENNVLTPKIQGKAVQLSGFFIIVAVTLFGALLGVLGALTAVPLAATLQIFVQELTKARREEVALEKGELPGAETAPETA